MNLEFSFSYTSYQIKVKEPSLPYYSSIAGGKIVRFIPFPKVFALCEIQTVSYKIWTQIAICISPQHLFIMLHYIYGFITKSQRKNAWGPGPCSMAVESECFDCIQSNWYSYDHNKYTREMIETVQCGNL